MDIVRIAPCRLAGGLFLAAGVFLLWILVPIGTRPSLPLPLRVVAFTTVDLGPGIFFILFGLYELGSSERYELVMGGQELRITRTLFFRATTTSWPLAGREFVLLDRGAAGLFGGTRLYELRASGPGKAMRGDWVAFCYPDTAIRLVAILRSAGGAVRIDGKPPPSGGI